MAYTADFSVTVGNPTKATDVATLAANDDYLKAAVDAKASLSGSTNNTIATVTGANALIGEANLTFDGSKLTVTGDQYIANGYGLVIGHTAQVAVNGQLGEFQLHGTADADGTVIQSLNAASSLGPVHYFAKSRNASVGSFTVVQSGDSLGRLMFFGDDGTDFGSWGAGIFANVDGTPGANDMPGRLAFYTTADGAASGTERLRIDSSGNVGIGTSAPLEMLDVTGATSANQARIVINDTYNGSASEAGIDFYRTYDTGGANQLAGYIRHTRGGGDVNAGMVFGYGTRGAVADKMTIDSNGVVHIGGTTATSNWSPTAYLNIEGTIPAITLRDTTGSADDWTFVNSNGVLTIANDTNNTQDLVIDESGNVGIGETSPDTTLHVNGAYDNNNGNAKLQSNNNDASLLTFWNKDSSPHAASRRWKIAANNTANGTLELAYGASSTGVPTTVAMAIDSSGDITMGGGTGNYSTAFLPAGFSNFSNVDQTNGSQLELGRGTNADATWVGVLNFVNTLNANAGNGAGGSGIAQIIVESQTTDSNAGDDSGGHMLFYTKGEAAASAERMRIDSSGQLTVKAGGAQVMYVDANGRIFNSSESSNANMTVGMTLQQGGHDNEILSFKSSDVAHGMTNLAETDTYGAFNKVSGTLGGLVMHAFGEGEQTLSMRLRVVTGLGDTTDTTSSNAPADFHITKRNGVTAQDMGSTDNLWAVRNNGTARIIVKGDGTVHASDTSWATALDDMPDALAGRAYNTEMANRQGAGLLGGMEVHAPELVQRMEDAGIVTHAEKEGEGFIVGHRFLNVQKGIKFSWDMGFQNFSFLAEIAKVLSSDQRAALPTQMQDAFAMLDNNKIDQLEN